MRNAVFAACIAGCAGSVCAQPIIVESRFAADREGWTTWTDLGATFTPTWVASGGNPGGYIQQSDPDAGYFYFRAPAAYLGNRSAAVGGTLSFDLRESSNGTLNDQPDVILRGGGIEIFYDTYNNPETNRFLRYHVLLSHTAQWHVGSLAGPLASAAQVQQVLGDLTDLLIRGEYVSGSETTRLDNVVLRQPRVGLPFSTFDVDTEDWDVIADAMPAYWSASGNPGGALRVDDIGDGRTWGYLAPCSFMGDLSSALGGRLEFDIWTTDNNTPNAPEVWIDSEGMRLEYDAHLVPAENTWEARSVPLYPTPEWRLDGNVPTPAQFALVLSAVTSIYIKGEFGNSYDTGMLDNVFVRVGCVGDLNGDGLVDDSDFVIFVGAYNILDCADPSMAPGCPADLNSDGFVDDADFVLFVGAYNELLCP